MKKFEKNIDDRKVLVARISELTGLNSHYTRVPRCAYEIGSFAVEKDGRLTVEEGADESILETLSAENLIGECVEETHPVRVMPEGQPMPAPTQIIQPELGTEEWGEDDFEEAETTTEAHEEQEVWRPDTDIFAEPVPQPAAEDTSIGETEEADPIPNAEYAQEAAEESAASLGIRETDEGFPLDAQISFPLSRHTAASITNLICMIRTRGPLLSKATEGRFHVDKDLVDEILDRHTFIDPAELIRFLQEWDDGNAVTGISFDEGKVIFDGFTEVKDADHLQAFMKLAAAMNKMAQTQKRVQAKETDDTNEKYALRAWLVRLGLNGPGYKAERKILMEHLSGHAAFRTPADEEKWKARQQAKKNALKTAKELGSEAE